LPPCTRAEWDQRSCAGKGARCPILIRGTLNGDRVQLSTAKFLPPTESRDLEPARARKQGVLCLDRVHLGRGRGVLKFRFGDRRDRQVNSPMLIAGPMSSPVVIAPECSLALPKSRRRLTVCLQVPLGYREELENSPGMRPQRRGSPPRSIPPQAFHLPSSRRVS
jgi:hypothetical protein